MQTIAFIIQVLFPFGLAIALIRRWAYAKPVQRVLRNLAGRRSARKAYALAVAILILVWNFACFSRFGASVWLLPGLAVGLALLSFKVANAFLLWGGRHQILMFVLYAISAYTLQVPQLISLSMVLILMAPATYFYPSDTAIEEMEDFLRGVRCPVSDEELAEYYFRDK